MNTAPVEVFFLKRGQAALTRSQVPNRDHFTSLATEQAYMQPVTLQSYFRRSILGDCLAVRVCKLRQEYPDWSRSEENLRPRPWLRFYGSDCSCAKIWLRPSITSGDKKLHAPGGVGGLTHVAVPTGGKPLLWQKKQLVAPADVLLAPCWYVSIVLLVRKLVPTWLLLLAGGVALLSVGAAPPAVHVAPEKM